MKTSNIPIKATIRQSINSRQTILVLGFMFRGSLSTPQPETKREKNHYKIIKLKCIIMFTNL